MIFETKIETQIWAKDLAQKLKAGDVIRLDGDLGAGKTQVVQWMGEALGVEEPITSPTFSLVNHYQAENFRINHLDLYRLEDQEEIEAINYEDLFFPDQEITFIEWAERVDDYLPRDYIHLVIEKRDGEGREIKWLSNNPRSEELKKLTEQ